MQYVGARYVPKFMGLYDATQAYEALCVVDNGMGTSYITKVPTPAGTPLTDTDYYAVYGASSGAIINLQNQIGDLNDLNTTDKDSLVDAINEVDGDIQTLAKLASLNPKQFGATCDKDIDDSVAVQAMFDYALANHIAHANFYDMNEISFKNVQIKSDMVIDFGDCKFYGVPKTDNRIYNMLTVNDANVSVVIKGGEFIGYGGNTPTTNANVDANPPLIDVTTANSINIEGGYYHNINNTNEGVTPTTPLAQCCGGLFRIHDCKFTSICNNVFDKNYSSELIFIINVAYDRKDVNAEVKNNVFGDTTTSAFDFVGNNIEVCGNTYNYDFLGSVANVMGLNVSAHDEIINGYFDDVYDNSESNYFQGDNVDIRNIIVKEIKYVARLAAKNIKISNVHIEQLGAHETGILNVEKGYSGTTTLHPDVATSELDSCTITIDNCNMEHLDGNASFVFCTTNTNLEPLINIVNSVSPKITAEGTRRYSLVWAKKCDVIVSHCKLYSRLNIGFSGTNTVVFFIDSDAMKSLKVIGCEIVNVDDSHLCYLTGGDTSTIIFVVGNNAISTNTINYVDNSTSVLVQSANNNFT